MLWLCFRYSTSHKTDWSISLPLRGSTGRLNKRSARPWSRPEWDLQQWDKAMSLCYTRNPRRRKARFLVIPISKTLTTDAKRWFCWWPKHLRNLIKRQTYCFCPKILTWNVWSGESIFIRQTYHDFRHRFRICIKFWLCGWVGSQFQTNLEMYLNFTFLTFQMGLTYPLL